MTIHEMKNLAFEQVKLTSQNIQSFLNTAKAGFVEAEHPWIEFCFKLAATEPENRDKFIDSYLQQPAHQRLTAEDIEWARNEYLKEIAYYGYVVKDDNGNYLDEQGNKLGPDDKHKAEIASVGGHYGYKTDTYYGTNFPGGWLAWFTTKDKYRNRGLGNDMLQSMIAKNIVAGYEAMHVGVFSSPTTIAAEKLYSKAGFLGNSYSQYEMYNTLYSMQLPVKMTKENYNLFLQAAKKDFPSEVLDQVEFSYLLAITPKEKWSQLNGWKNNESWARHLKEPPQYYGFEPTNSDGTPSGEFLSSGYHCFKEVSERAKIDNGGNNIHDGWTVMSNKYPRESKVLLNAVKTLSKENKAAGRIVESKPETRLKHRRPNNPRFTP